MADLTKIEWCDATLNLWWGCTKVSDGCKFCYAEHLADHRHHRGNWGPTGIRREVKSWRSTLRKISKRAKAEGRRLRVFCSSMSDVFEGPVTMGGVESENYNLVCSLQLQLMFAILDHPELDFLLLTKRPDNVMPMIRRIRYHNSEKDHPDFQRLYDELIWPWTNGVVPENVWIGTSVEDQKTADERIPHLREIPARVRFLSCEPLLNLVDLSFWLDRAPRNDVYGSGKRVDKIGNIHWVICGGESGPNARPMHPEWARSLRDQCKNAGVPFMFKQWGEWVPDDSSCAEPGSTVPNHVTVEYPWLEWDEAEQSPFGDHEAMLRVGKKAAGRILDGLTWDEVPT